MAIRGMVTCLWLCHGSGGGAQVKWFILDGMPLALVPHCLCWHLSGGNLYTLGNNNEGQLGTGDYTNHSSPTLVGVDTWVSGTVTDVAAGQYFTVVVAGVCVCVCLASP